MLGSTAAGLFWMSRYIERADNVARLLETGLRMSLVRRDRAVSEWEAVLASAGQAQAFAAAREGAPAASSVADFMLRDGANPSSALQCIEAARSNARRVRTAITREVWEAINDACLDARRMLAAPLPVADLPDALERIRRSGSQIAGAFDGTMLRNDIYRFARLGTHLERADSTARILDVKYHLLLPDAEELGGALDRVQWEQLLRSVQVNRAYAMAHGTEYAALPVAEFLILDERMPRSLAYCAYQLSQGLAHLSRDYGRESQAAKDAGAIFADLHAARAEDILVTGLHEFLEGFIARNAALADSIGTTFRFQQ